MRFLIYFLFYSLLTSFPSYARSTDEQLLQFFNRQRTPALDAPMAAITNSVYPLATAMPLAQLIYGYTTHNNQCVQKGWQTVGAIGINAILTFSLKYSINRTRPYITYPAIIPYNLQSDPSFPSGHTSYAFAAATTIGLQYHKWYLTLPAYAWASSVGISRLYLGEHYPTDVLAGAICGAGSAWLSYKGMQFLQSRRRKVASKP
jgi:undecaprenyl-diphosphatase